MKKVLYIALALVLALGLVIPLAGCGAVGESDLQSGGRVVALDGGDEPAPSAQATIYTDKTDYEPGDTAAFTGSGFQPGETVNIEAVGETNGSQLTAEVVADDSGAISGSLELPLVFEATYDVTATGDSSGLVAGTSFGDKVGDVVVTSLSIDPTGMLTFSPGQTQVYVATAKTTGNDVVPGVPIEWSTESSSGSSLSPTSGNTGGDGTTSTTLTAGSTAGTYSVTATGGGKSASRSYKIEVPTPPTSMPGAIWTTDSNCEKVNGNIYDSKEAVYLDGGPDTSSNHLPNGNYYVQVTTPGGAPLGSTPTASVLVTNGEITQCYQLWAILTKASDGSPGYDTTLNPGGEYKVWVSQDAAFDENASKTDNFKVVAVTPVHGEATTTTDLYNATGTYIPVNGHVPLGTIVYDTATLTGNIDGTSPTGNVTFILYKGTDNTGEVIYSDTQPVGTQSINSPPLHAGSYVFQATYNGDTVYDPVTSDYEPFVVDKGTVTISTTPILPADSPIPLGSTAKDSATVTGSYQSFVPTGTVDFILYKGVPPDITDPIDSQAGVSLEDGVAETPKDSPPLHAGYYYYVAGNYSGGDDYEALPGNSKPEPFEVNKGTVNLATTIYNAAGDTVIPLTSHVELGTSAYDMVTVTGETVFFHIADVTYQFNGAAAGSGAKSATEGPLHAGNYAFQAFFVGNDDYYQAQSDTEPFVVDKGTSTIVTEIHNGLCMVVDWVLPGSKVHDKATVTVDPVVFTPDGTATVTYTLYKSDNTVVYSSTVALGLESGVSPALNAGSYYYVAVYSGNSDYEGSTSDKEPLTVVNTGALTMGYWQNKNGQALITGSSNGGLRNFLRGYAPFQDLSSTATPSQVATYVTNVIKAASAAGAAMNAMLKAQMLATALDVYFSDPLLGGNKIGASHPIGGVLIDLTRINKPIGSGTYENCSSSFGPANSLTVSQMLAYAASRSSAGGLVVWYNQVKNGPNSQELAKDAFDAVNNQKVFSP